MKPVERGDIVDYVTYEDIRNTFRAEVMNVKAVRRVHIGEYLTLLFENNLTVRYQIQEMVRAERLVREADIVHEIETYNELLGGEGELGCTLLIEVDDPQLRDKKLHEWLELPRKLYALIEDGSRIFSVPDQRQRDEVRLSSVQYLKFNTGGRVPVAIAINLHDLKNETRLNDATREALRSDLRSR
jgi:hypothetical protein